MITLTIFKNKFLNMVRVILKIWSATTLMLRDDYTTSFFWFSTKKTFQYLVYVNTLIFNRSNLLKKISCKPIHVKIFVLFPSNSVENIPLRPGTPVSTRHQGWFFLKNHCHFLLPESDRQK